ncbi:DUF4232 domain-containing protein [Streptomyces sp. NBC_01775]|uniref:DUF4232 domain-containing protein n=1 Tax=Streptomyces sp. NBC_01775 TaxID=2975939 RepID=UPI002DDC7A2B|nr:DUF4232 domain-containing protein [Streptomyces sp. NBC_01775]WSB80463.1 DUF4232 domain-containing protein [Streptomyces sp. NBC_01775]
MTQHHDDTSIEQQAGTARMSARPRRKAARVAAAATAVLAAGALLVGCGGKDSDASGTHKSGGDAAPAGSQSKAQGGGSEKTDTLAAKSGTSSANFGSSKPGSCTSQDLKATIGPNHPGAGQENFSLVLTNKSGESCTVRGYPGFAFLNSDDEQVSVDPERDGSSARAIKLGAGDSAWAALSFSNPKATGVPTVTPKTALITPPDQRSSLRVSWKGGPVTATGKASVPKIGTLNPGTGG